MSAIAYAVILTGIAAGAIVLGISALCVSIINFGAGLPRWGQE